MNMVKIAHARDSAKLTLGLAQNIRQICNTAKSKAESGKNEYAVFLATACISIESQVEDLAKAIIFLSDGLIPKG